MPPDKRLTKEQLEEYVNLPHIHKPLSSIIEERPAGQPPSTQDGKKLHASILWNPNVLASGPQDARGDDPDKKRPPVNSQPIRVDKPLLDIQSEEYKATIDNYLNQTQLNQPPNPDPAKALKEFGKISKPTTTTYVAQQVFISFFLRILFYFVFEIVYFRVGKSIIN